MHFTANNFTVSVLLLMAVTVFMIGVRIRKPVENNWLLLYWMAMAAFTLTRHETSFDFRYIFVGLIAGLMLRFEFMNRTFTRIVMLVEMAAFAYVLLAVGSPIAWLAWAGPLTMYVFLRWLSGVPHTERQALRTRGDDYRRYQRSTPMLFPWFPKEDR